MPGPSALFCCAVGTGDVGLVRQVLEQWLDGKPLAFKAKLSGAQFIHDSEEFSLYAYEAFSSPGSPKEFLLEGRAALPLDGMKQKLTALKALFDARGVTGQFDYTAINETGDPIGDEQSV
jgi:hypothetical protein